MAKVYAVIPARYGSTRLPGKPLRLIDGRPMIRRVYEGAVASGLFAGVIVATDDRRIADVVTGFGGDARLTSAEHPSGTDRVAEIAAGLDADLVVNVQGDLPFPTRALLGAPLAAMLADETIPMGTVSVPIYDRDRWLDPNVVKVVTDTARSALYFSRAPIPARSHRGTGGKEGTPALWGEQHVGLYAYRKEFLLRFASWPPTPLEKLERLEQLRALERGERIYVGACPGPIVEVDTAEDLERAEQVATGGMS